MCFFCWKLSLTLYLKKSICSAAKIVNSTSSFISSSIKCGLGDSLDTSMEYGACTAGEGYHWQEGEDRALSEGDCAGGALWYAVQD